MNELLDGWEDLGGQGGVVDQDLGILDRHIAQAAKAAVADVETRGVLFPRDLLDAFVGCFQKHLINNMRTAGDDLTVITFLLENPMLSPETVMAFLRALPHTLLTGLAERALNARSASGVHFLAALVSTGMAEHWKVSRDGSGSLCLEKGPIKVRLDETFVLPPAPSTP